MALTLRRQHSSESSFRLELTRPELEAVFRTKYGAPDSLGPNPRLWRRYGYYHPDEYYEAMVAKLVNGQSTWLDVGCGHDLLSANPKLAQVLSDRCALLVGLDPDDAVADNRWVHEAVKGTLEDYQSDRTFDIITLCMVAEHLPNAEASVKALARLTKPGGRVILYTVSKWSPLAVLARLVPFRLHHAIKRRMWGSQECDTFPVAYRMNTRARVSELFLQRGFKERYFAALADCRVLARFGILHHAELSVWRLLNTIGLPYPERCLLAVYERQGFYC
jgi:2-polyprenyl-3-methyl-5-hydroxy-6-metoxy-1,4-benzoquinol methylase